MHAAFGRGSVLSVRKMGLGDALLEIAFDDIGTKSRAKTFGAYEKAVMLFLLSRISLRRMGMRWRLRRFTLCWFWR